MVNLSVSIRKLRRNYPFLVMAAPAFLLLVVFSYLPMFGVVIAFKNYKAAKGILGSDWIGFKNFEYLVRTPDLMRITRNTVFLNLLFISTSLVGSISLALLLNEVRVKLATRIYQTVIFFPFIIGWVIVGYFSFAILNYESGLINTIARSLGIEPTTWFSLPAPWPTILTITNLWKGVGIGSVIYLAAMLGINQEYYEAAMLDGANKFQQILYITLPFLIPIMVITTLLTIGKIFYADFGMFYYVTRDSKLLYSTTDVIDTYVFRALRVNADVGMAASAGLYQSVVGFFLVIFSNWVVKQIDPDRSLF